MVFKLLLTQLPQAAGLLRRLIDASPTQAEKTMLRTAMDLGTDDMLTELESTSGLTESLRHGGLTAMGGEVRRIAAFLRDVKDNGSDTASNRIRLKGICETIDTICRGRLAEGMKSGLLTPLGQAHHPLNAAEQKDMENCARDLRFVDMAGRKLGSPAAYDALLSEATDAVEAAVDSGGLGAVRAVRLVEILSGPEAAEAIYKKAAVAASRGK